MPSQGLTRVPFYPELRCFDQPSEELTAQVLSLLLYWYSLSEYQIFNSRKHLRQIARSLRVENEAVAHRLDYLVQLQILNKSSKSFMTTPEHGESKLKTDCYYELDFHNLSQALKSHQLNIEIKTLRQASNDSFDFYTYLSPHTIPKTQGLRGQLNADIYELAVTRISTFICKLINDEHSYSFIEQALAPGWRLLTRPPLEIADLSSRWLIGQDRAIDLELEDGVFFIPDAQYFGTKNHHLLHTKKTNPAQILACALYAICTGCNKKLEFYSDLDSELIIEGFKLSHQILGIKANLQPYFFSYRDLNGTELEQFKQAIEPYIES